MTKSTRRNQGNISKSSGNRRVSRRVPVREHVVELLAGKMAKAILEGIEPLSTFYRVKDPAAAARAIRAARAFNREVYGREEIGKTRRGKHG